MPESRRWSHTMTLYVLLLVATIGLGGEPSASHANTGSTLLVTAQQLADHLRDRNWRIVDIRPPQQYATSHIPGAVHLPIEVITRTLNDTPGMLAPPAHVTRVLSERGISRESRVVIYDDFGGVMATRLFWVLDYLGHPRTSLLQGGFALWKGQGRPTSRKVPQSRTTAYEVTPNAAKLADRSWVKAHLQDSGIILLDARSPREYLGQTAGSPIEHQGHIPGAINLDWVNNLTSTAPRQFKPRADLLQLYKQKNLTPDKEIVVYCRTGMRATHDYFVLRLLGYPRVRLYDGSFVEWSADPTAPVER